MVIFPQTKTSSQIYARIYDEAALAKPDAHMGAEFEKLNKGRKDQGKIPYYRSKRYRIIRPLRSESTGRIALDLGETYWEYIALIAAEGVDNSTRDYVKGKIRSAASR